MTLVKEWVLPIETVSESNTHQHWSKTYKLRKLQAHAIDIAWKLDNPTITLPCIIRMTRIAVRECDDDNLRSCFKAIRDRLAFHITGLDKGRGDSDPRIEWQYDQMKGKIKGFGKGVKIEFVSKFVG